MSAFKKLVVDSFGGLFDWHRQDGGVVWANGQRKGDCLKCQVLA
jgi:hypothetical protein